MPTTAKREPFVGRNNREPIDLIALLKLGTLGLGRAGAVSGAAQLTDTIAASRACEDPPIALSDGSRITFTSVADAGVYNDGCRVLILDKARLVSLC
jgi:hypothetical protein